MTNPEDHIEDQRELSADDLPENPSDDSAGVSHESPPEGSLAASNIEPQEAISVQAVRKPVIAGNWKMYKSIAEGVAFVKDLIPLLAAETPEKDRGDEPENLPAVYLAVPYTCIQSIVKAARGSRIEVGAQNMNDASEGSFTGEIAAKMLKEVGAGFVILGHSERRMYFNEDNAFINRKVKRALLEGLQPILCIGETLALHQKGKSKETVEKQLAECLDGLSGEQLADCIVAYEPVWAIGSGSAATPEIAQEIHGVCRQFIGNKWGTDAAEKLRILYGGSVKPNNAAELMAQPDIDGLLVGGASLSLDFFSQIVNYDRHGIVSEGESV